MKHFFIFLFSSILFSFVASAQQTYTWDDYGIAFTLADDFQETVSNGDEFLADGDGMTLTILPFSDESVDDSDIVNYTIDIAASLNLSRIDDINIINFNGFEGGYAEGESEGVKFFMMGVIDPQSDTNFFVIITFLDGDGNAAQEAINICKSISKI